MLESFLRQDMNDTVTSEQSWTALANVIRAPPALATPPPVFGGAA